MTRDSQRSAVYRWEGRSIPGRLRGPERPIEAVAAVARSVWGKERGRYGLAKRACPPVKGGNGAAWGSIDGLKLPPWARRSNAVILHELAHALDARSGYGKGRRGAHGPRFVGIFIGLLARHAGLDAQVLMAQANEMGVRYDVRSIGAVPRIGLDAKLQPLLPCTIMEAAVQAGVSYRQIQGAALLLIKRGVARYRGKTLIAQEVQP